jgi:hypothetical protein
MKCLSKKTDGMTNVLPEGLSFLQLGLFLFDNRPESLGLGFPG